MCIPVFPDDVSGSMLRNEEEVILETEEELESESDEEEEEGMSIIDYDYDDPEFLSETTPPPSFGERVSSMVHHLLQKMMAMEQNASFSGCNIRISNNFTPIDNYVSFYEINFETVEWVKVPRDPRFENNVLLRRTSLRAREWAITSRIFRAQLWHEEAPTISVSDISSVDIADEDLGITDHSGYEYVYSEYVVWLDSHILLPSETEIRESAVIHEQPDPDKIVYFLKHLIHYDEEFYIQIFTRVAVMK